MRRLRLLLTAGLAGLLLLPAPARADTHLGLHGMTCTGITAMGKGLPKSSTLGLALVDPASKETLVQRTVRTSATGAFETHLRAPLYQRLKVRLLVTGAGGQRIGFAEHAMAEGAPMCDLPFTGPSRTGLLLGLGLGLLASGSALLLLGRGWRPRPAPGA
jgi:hypothetical protein